MGWGELVVQNVGGGTVSSYRELLDIREAAWRPLLRRVSLVAEAEIPEKQRTQAAVGLGHYYRRSERTTDAGLVLLAKWPACLILAMTGVAVTDYGQGTYWPRLWRAIGYQGRDADQQIWGEAFLRA